MGLAYRVGKRKENEEFDEYEENEEHLPTTDLMAEVPCDFS